MKTSLIITRIVPWAALDSEDAVVISLPAILCLSRPLPLPLTFLTAE